MIWTRNYAKNSAVERLPLMETENLGLMSCWDTAEKILTLSMIQSFLAYFQHNLLQEWGTS